MEASRNVALTPRETHLHFPSFSGLQSRYPETHLPGAGSFQEEPQSAIGDNELGHIRTRLLTLHLAPHALGHNGKSELGRVGRNTRRGKGLWRG